MKTNFDSKEASYIVLKAKPGKAADLERFLIQGAELIKTTEPQTKLWLALKMDKDTFAIFDTFTDESARAAHFAGQVAAALKENAEDLIEGGWEQGVLNHVMNFQIIASC